MNDNDAKAATPHRELLRQLLDSRIPKSEREWAAAREIERHLTQAERDAIVHGEPASCPVCGQLWPKDGNA